MAKKKKKHQGHYCKICGEYKANEKFSGKGHALHICKSCMSKKGKSTESNIEDLPIVDDDWYDLDFNMCNPDIDNLPTEYLEPVRYKKLDKETKIAIKDLWAGLVERYWEDTYQIPFGEPSMRLRKELIELFAGQGDIRLVEDNDLKTVLNDNTIIIINKLLKR